MAEKIEEVVVDDVKESDAVVDTVSEENTLDYKKEYENLATAYNNLVEEYKKLHKEHARTVALANKLIVKAGSDYQKDLINTLFAEVDKELAEAEAEAAAAQK